MDDLIKDGYRPYIRGFCEGIKIRCDLGSSLRPLYLIPISARGGEVPDLSEAALRVREAAQAKGLIEWLIFLRSEFPEIAHEFNDCLGRAEQVWKPLASA